MKKLLPTSLTVQNLDELFVGLTQSNGTPTSLNISIDFKDLSYIDPTGVTALSNLINWLRMNGVTVLFENHQLLSAGCVFLDDIKFFEHFLGSPLRDDAGLRPTSRSLEFIGDNSRMWLKTDFLQWLSRNSGLSFASFDLLYSAILEIFHNIDNHSTARIGAVFAQYLPTKKQLLISISDIGVGIPFTVKKALADTLGIWLDSEAIEKACELGFTSRSVAGNAGRGFPNLIDCVAGNYNGIVRIISGRGYVQFSQKSKRKFSTDMSWIYPGSMVSLKIDMSEVPNIESNSEDFTW